MWKDPTSYAAHLATYIASPLKIEALTRIAFARAPELHKIAQMRFAVEQEDKRRKLAAMRDAPTDHDGRDYRVRPAPVEPAPKPEPAPRVRDYLAIPPTSNPFAGAFSIGQRVVRSVAGDFGLAPAEITGKARWQYLIDARAVVVMLLRLWGKSTTEIGNIMGGRDHSTVIHAIHKFDIYLERNPTALACYRRHVALMEEAHRLHGIARQEAGL